MVETTTAGRWWARILAIGAVVAWAGVAQAQVFRFQSYSVAEGLPSDVVYGLFQDNKGYLWIATENGVCRHDGVEIGRAHV